MEKTGLAFFGIGLPLLASALFGVSAEMAESTRAAWLSSALGLIISGGLAYGLHKHLAYKPGIGITTNGAQCISSGNCSNYFEMGIDVRHYAQRGQNMIGASCVGCGLCAAVCPRGVLSLENGQLEGRYNNEHGLPLYGATKAK